MITGTDLKSWGFPEGPLYKTVLKAFNHPACQMGKTQAKVLVQAMLADPESLKGHAVMGPAVKEYMASLKNENKKTAVLLNANHCPLEIFGDGMIEQGALSQIYTAAKLPISVRAALMPDAHAGIGICIGGVLATDNTVIPNCVGVDIGCRMKLTVLDIPGGSLAGMKDKLVGILERYTVFGKGVNDGSVDHPVLYDERFEIARLKKMNLKFVAQKAIGSQGGGNHFAEFGIVTVEGSEPLVALLTHSGSRGVGHKIAVAYSGVAIEKCHLQGDAKGLSWLELTDPDGQEYWQAMELAGDFSKACHDIVHTRIAEALGVRVVRVFENHHNFAWKERIVVGNSECDAVVHRKGATPAGLGVYGVIPGSSTTPTFITKGRGNPSSICSSSHGAGRLMSRKAAKETFTMSQMKQNLEEAGVLMIGGAAVDECSMAYKDIRQVMKAQGDLVEIVGEFHPKIVRMSGEEEKPWDKE